MHEKEFSLLARVLPHMLARWRLPEDLETLASLPDGRIIIDVSAGTARHESAGPVTLAIAAELKAGLEERLGKQGIAPATVREVLVWVETDTSRVKTDRSRIVHFDLRIACRLLTDAGEFLGSQQEEHVWHERMG